MPRVLRVPRSLRGLPMVAPASCLCWPGRRVNRRRSRQGLTLDFTQHDADIARAVAMRDETFEGLDELREQLQLEAARCGHRSRGPQVLELVRRRAARLEIAVHHALA